MNRPKIQIVFDYRDDKQPFDMDCELIETTDRGILVYVNDKKVFYPWHVIYLVEYK